MAIITFDALLYVQKAEQVGFSKAQAEFQASELGKFFNQTIKHKKSISFLKNKWIILQKDVSLLQRDVNIMQKDIAIIKNNASQLEEKIINKMTIRLGSMLVIFMMLLPIIMKLIGKM